MAQMVKRLPAMRDTQVQSLGWEDTLEKEMATHSSTPAWKIPWMEEASSLQSMGLQRVGHDWATSLHFTSYTYLRTRYSQRIKGYRKTLPVWNPEVLREDRHIHRVYAYYIVVSYRIYLFFFWMELRREKVRMFHDVSSILRITYH